MRINWKLFRRQSWLIEVPFLNLPEGLGTITKTRVKTAGEPAKIPVPHFESINVERYRYSVVITQCNLVLRAKPIIAQLC
jgi:hypothetical protein